MKWRPQVSLLSLLLLLTTSSLAIGLWQMGRDIVPLRNTVRELREELGQFHVADLDRVHVQRGETVAGSMWKWRLYLPTGSDFNLHAAEGVLDELQPGNFAEWKRSNRLLQHPLSLNASGQFTLELAVEEHGGKWWIKTASHNEVRVTTQLEADWYAELGKQVQYSDASYERVSITDAAEPVVLLYVRRGEKEMVGDTYVTKQVAGEAETLVIWLKQVPAPGKFPYPYGPSNFGTRPRITPHTSER